MCGIAGKIYLGEGEVSASEIKKMTDKIFYRGPDDEGIYISKDRKIGLGNVRLAIIDLSKNAHQPMSYLNRYVITFNGEIYNFLEEKNKLIKIGYTFKSNSDTEVILALYDRYKTGCLKYMRGMFAFAIYDIKEKTVFLARDRIGKKPLKYFFNGNVFIFASELKAILTQKDVKKSVDWLAIHHFITYGYVPSPRTGFEKIYKLEPGHYLWFDLKRKKLEKKKYWMPDFSKKLQLSEEEWCEQILIILEESIRLRLISDVDIGAFLSGGVDSSSVVAMMSTLSNKPVKTFTIGFKDRNDDERVYAQKIVKLYKTNHETLIAKPESVEEILPKLSYLYDEPFADSSSLITYQICKLASKFVKVVLTGDGGDENFAGYDNRMRRLQRDVDFERFSGLFRSIGVPPTSLISKLTGLKFATRIYKFLEKSKLDIAERYSTYNCLFTNDEKLSLYSDEFKVKFKKINSYEIAKDNYYHPNIDDLRDRALYLDLVSWLPDSQLLKVDIASMSNSLESRSPYLDQKMIELAAKIPFDLKVRGNNYKYILKKAVEKIVPKENLYRKKMGFTVPLDKWYKGNLKNYSKYILLSKYSFTVKVFNKSIIQNMLDSHSETNDFGQQLWTLLSLELWYQSYFY